jgi:rSAM/selenodomain-associated transferase 1
MGRLAYQWKTKILMLQKKLFIVFAKNGELGKVKTRLAQTIGNEGALRVYLDLLQITEEVSSAVENVYLRIYFSDYSLEDRWPGKEKYIQQGADLGQRMKNAFEQGFNDGFTSIVGIGADLPEITPTHISDAFHALESMDFVYGPALDGGYYLVGISFDKGLYVFENKPWSTEDLFQLTKAEILENQHSVFELETLNDIDTLEDLKASAIAANYQEFIQLQ